MGEFTLDQDRALIARARIAELKSCGWRVIGPGEEGSVWMEGPPLAGRLNRMTGRRIANRAQDDDSAQQPVGALFEDLIARALARADATLAAADRAKRQAA
jgi:hypothetical protein